MNINLPDIDINNQILPLLDHVIGDDRYVINRMGRYTVMVLPFRQVAYDAERNAPGILTKSGYISVIDHDTDLMGGGKFSSNEGREFLDLETGRPYPKPEEGLYDGYGPVYGSSDGSVALPIERLFSAVKEGDIESVVRTAPNIFHLDENNELTHVLGVMGKVALKRQEALVGEDVDWMVSRVMGPASVSLDDMPESIESAFRKYGAIKNNASYIWVNDESDYYRKTSHKLRGGSSELGVMTLDDYQEKASNGHLDFIQSGKLLRLVAEPDDSQDNNFMRFMAGENKIDAMIYKESERTIKDACTLFLKAYRESFIDKANVEGSTVGREALKGHVEYVVERVGYQSEALALFMSGSAEAIRNKSQLLSRFERSVACISLLKEDLFRNAIEGGASLREAVSCFALLNTSKKTVNQFLHNVDVNHEYRNLAGSSFYIEKGPVAALSGGGFGSRGLRLNAVALMTTLPESPFQKMGEERNAEAMWELLSSAPLLIETLSERVRRVREGRASMKDALTWVRPYVEHPADNDISSLDDAGRMLYDTYYQPIVDHLNYHADTSIQADLFMEEKKMNAYLMCRKISESGEYRDLIRASDVAHKTIHQTYKNSRPDHSVDWPACVKPYEIGGIEISAVTSNYELSEEGRELDHCVGSYLKSVINNESYILSVKIDGKRSSTIELQGYDLGDLHIVQHRGKSNRAPSEDEVALGKILLGKIKSGEVEFDFEPCQGVSLALESLSPPERKEVMDGIAFTRRDVIVGLIDDFQKIAPTLNIWKMLKENEQNLNGSGVDELQRDYFSYKHKERVLNIPAEI